MNKFESYETRSARFVHWAGGLNALICALLALGDNGVGILGLRLNSESSFEVQRDFGEQRPGREGSKNPDKSPIEEKTPHEQSEDGNFFALVRHSQRRILRNSIRRTFPLAHRAHTIRGDRFAGVTLTRSPSLGANFHSPLRC
jgi:hypothetical protein